MPYETTEFACRQYLMSLKYVYVKGDQTFTNVIWGSRKYRNILDEVELRNFDVWDNRVDRIILLKVVQQTSPKINFNIV